MQDPLDTVDPLSFNLNHLQSSRTKCVAAAPRQWIDKTLNDEDIDVGVGIGIGIGMTLQNELWRHRYPSSDDQLEILGQFEFGGDQLGQQAQPWVDASPVYGLEEEEEEIRLPEERRNSTGYAPWNHLQAFDTPNPHGTHLYRLNSENSDASGVISTTETLALPGNSPPDSGLAFLCGQGYTGPNEDRIQYPQDAYGLSNLQGETIDPAAHGSVEHLFQNTHQPEGAFHSTHGGSYPLLNHSIDITASYSDTGTGSYVPYDTWNYLQGISPYLTGRSFSSPQEENPLPSCWDEPTSCRHEDPLTEYAGITHPQSGAINIEGTSERFQSDLARSFPPTAGFYPEYWPVRAKDEPRNAGEARSRPFALRPASRISRVNRKHSISATVPTLSVIHEDGKGGLALSALNTKGRRVGPLSKSKAAQAAKNRKEKCVCIRCKMMKQSCSGEEPCRGCKENVNSKIWKSPCVKAEFLDMIEAGTCNYISQRSINHLTLDQSRRVTMLLPETFNLTQLLELLKPRLSRFNIHARQLSGSLYTLDLAKCYDFLSEIHKGQVSGTTFQLRDFIDNKLLKASDWLSCVTEPCSITESLALLAKWNNMPSRASYDIVSLTEGVPSRPMDVENPDDRIEILIAAQLSRIICRALEVAAFKFLHQELNKYTKGSKSTDYAERFVRDLGQLLLTLRWRISWWEILGDGSAIRDDSRDRYVDRVKTLTKVLYFYYCNAKKKLPPWLDPPSLQGVQSCYADAEPIFDDFPHEDSIEGFHDWMKHGQELIHEAGVARRLSRY